MRDIMDIKAEAPAAGKKRVIVLQNQKTARVLNMIAEVERLAVATRMAEPFVSETT